MHDADIHIKPTTTHDDFTHEVVVINIENGSYFSLKGTAVDLWRGIAAGKPMSSLLEELAHTYAMNAPALGAVRSFFNTCVEDGLITMDDDADWALREREPSSNGGSTFPDPVIKKFTNMQDILLLDPIHDVDKSGWPNIQMEQER
jgi:hypothetical protein